MAKCEKILLAGFSGAGKTSFLRELESACPESGWNFLDLDELILKRHGKGVKTLAEVIERDGWEKFRLWERQELEGWLKDEEKGVLALGGGTLNQLVFDLYKNSTKVKICYLHASFQECWRRLHLEGSEPRPLVLKGKEALEKIYQERQVVFSQVAWRVENGSESSLSENAEEFWKKLS